MRRRGDWGGWRAGLGEARAPGLAGALAVAVACCGRARGGGACLGVMCGWTGQSCSCVGDCLAPFLRLLVVVVLLLLR